MRLGHADRQMAKALTFPQAQLIADFLVGQNFIGAVDALGDGFDLFHQAHVIRIECLELGAA